MLSSDRRQFASSGIDIVQGRRRRTRRIEENKLCSKSRVYNEIARADYFTNTIKTEWQCEGFFSAFGISANLSVVVYAHWNYEAVKVA